jgi:hypothetical protein
LPKNTPAKTWASSSNPLKSKWRAQFPKRGRWLTARVTEFGFEELVCPKNAEVFRTKDSKTCTRLVTRKKFLGFFELPRDNTETLRISNKIKGSATITDDNKKLLKIAKIAVFEL